MSEVLRKKLLYRSKHRGCKEMDLILSSFMEKNFTDLTENELLTFDLLLNEGELEIREWIVEGKTAPAQYKNLIEKIIYHRP